MPRSPKLSKNERAVTPVYSVRLERETAAFADALKDEINRREPERGTHTRSDVLKRAMFIGLQSLGKEYGVKPKASGR